VSVDEFAVSIYEHKNHALVERTLIADGELDATVNWAIAMDARVLLLVG